MNEIQLAENELLLTIAMIVSPNSVKDIANASNIKPSRLYKWRTTDSHLSAQKMDALMAYFAEKEPFSLIVAEIVMTVLLLLYNTSAS